MAVLSDYNHVDLKNSMTVALDFYTLFSNSMYTICSGLTVFLILHVHASKEITRLYINVLYLCFGIHDRLGAAGVARTFILLTKIEIGVRRV